MRASKLTLLCCAACLLAGGVGGWFCREQARPWHWARLKPLGSSSNPLPADLVILGRVVGFFDPEDSPRMVYRVKVLQVLRGAVEKDTVNVELPTLYESNEAWYPTKVPITDAEFEGLFVLNQGLTSAYAPQWIVPDKAFQWPPNPGLVNFIAEQFQPPAEVALPLMAENGLVMFVAALDVSEGEMPVLKAVYPNLSFADVSKVVLGKDLGVAETRLGMCRIVDSKRVTVEAAGKTRVYFKVEIRVRISRGHEETDALLEMLGLSPDEPHLLRTFHVTTPVYAVETNRHVISPIRDAPIDELLKNPPEDSPARGLR